MTNGMPPNVKRDSTNHFLPPPPNLYPLRHPLIQNHPRFMQHQPSLNAQQHNSHSLPTRQTIESPPIIPAQPLPQNATAAAPPPPSLDQRPSYFMGHPAPPVTILVPYPIILPIPIPIPIPMPIVEFLKAAQAKLEREKSSAHPAGSPLDNLQNQSLHTQQQPPSVSSVSDEPLDCTKSKTIPPALEPVIKTIEIEKQMTEEQFEKQLANDIQEISIDSECTSEPEPLKVTTEASEDQQQRLIPKLKITRFNSKRIVTKELVSTPLESSRPLRKRKRIIDCDYLRIKDDDKKKI